MIQETEQIRKLTSLPHLINIKTRTNVIAYIQNREAIEQLILCLVEAIQIPRAQITLEPRKLKPKFSAAYNQE